MVHIGATGAKCEEVVVFAFEIFPEKYQAPETLRASLFFLWGESMRGGSMSWGDQP